MQGPGLKQSLHLISPSHKFKSQFLAKESGLLIYLRGEKKKSCADPTFKPNLETFIKGIRMEFSHNRAYGWVNLIIDTEKKLNIHSSRAVNSY